jgi:formylglycine-generating enzyme required for sulfatase activity
MGNGKVRFDELPDDARPILSVPRVLEYIREISDDKLAAIRTPADVYYLSICRLLARALEDGSETARKLGCSRGASSTKPQDEQILRGLALLGAIAWEMTCTPAFETGDVPNFFLIPRSQLLNFKDLQVAPRYRVATGGSLTQDWTALGALNTILEHGFFDGSSAGLSEIQFRDRTLQEFCCAWYLAQHAFDPAELTAAADNLERQQTILRRQAADRDRLRKWMHLPEYVETEAYYGIWQFLCDMPGPRDAVQDETWLAAIEPLYQKSVANADGMRQVKRSSEMIFRSWSRLDRMCRGSHPYPRALQLRDDWLGEFDEILEGGQGPERMAAARELTESFLSIPAGEFQMGSPPEHQVLGGEMKSQYENWLKGRPPDPSQWNAYITDTFKENPPKSRAEKHWNLRFRTVLLKMLQSNSLISLEDYWQIRNETPEAEIQTVADFQLSRTPVLNAWYRLYTPEHGKAPAWFADDYSKYSATPRQPAIFVSFFDAWAFAMWAQWNGNQCRLPWENEWEYAAKFRRPGDWKYWWCRDYDKKSFDKRCNGNMNHGQTSEPITKHANPCTRKIDMARKGLMDMLGNVCEWCQDRCRVKYERTEEDDTPCDAGSPRTQRGGGWIYFLRGCRAALRVGNLPGFRSLDGGFRLARNSVEAGSRVD